MVRRYIVTFELDRPLLNKISSDDMFSARPAKILAQSNMKP
jgi:hypothetical protein